MEDVISTNLDEQIRNKCFYIKVGMSDKKLSNLVINKYILCGPPKDENNDNELMTCLEHTLQAIHCFYCLCILYLDMSLSPLFSLFIIFISFAD